MRTYKDPLFLIEEYWGNGKTLKQIGKEQNCHRATITYWMNKHSIPVKTRSECQRMKGKRKHHGYWRTYKPNHPRANNRGRVFEHILIAEQILGRYLTEDEAVHHIDGNKLNNKPENLYVSSLKRKHSSIHTNLMNVAFELVQKGVIKFNREKGEYYYGKYNL